VNSKDSVMMNNNNGDFYSFNIYSKLLQDTIMDLIVFRSSRFYYINANFHHYESFILLTGIKIEYINNEIF